MKASLSKKENEHEKFLPSVSPIEDFSSLSFYGFLTMSFAKIKTENEYTSDFRPKLACKC